MILEQIYPDILEMAKESDSILSDIYKRIDEIALTNSNRILSAFIENRVSYSDFADINGYGNYDEGRDKLEKIFATVLGCEDALVRPQIMSGTNALYLTLSALLKHGDTMISLSGAPYDSLQEMIGLSGNSTQSLKANGVKYEQIELVNDDFDDEKIVEENNNTVKTNVINTANVNNRFSSKNANALLNAKLQTAKNNPKSEAQLTPEDKTAQINMYSEPTAINTQTGNLEGHKELSQPLTGALSGRPISNNPEDGVKIDIYTKDGGKKVDKDGLKIPTIYKNDGNFPKDSNDGKIYYYDKASGIKVTIPRRISSGSSCDTDVYGAQQHMPLMDITVDI